MAARNRFAAADRHGMKHARRLFGIIDKSSEKRRLVARGHTPQNIQVQLHEIFLVVKHPSTYPQIQPGNVFDRSFCHQVGIQLGAHTCDQTAQLGAIILWQHGVYLFGIAGITDVFRQYFVVVL